MAKSPDTVLGNCVELLLPSGKYSTRSGESPTWLGNTRRSWRIQVFSSTDLTRASLVARLISAVASRSLISVFSISM